MSLTALLIVLMADAATRLEEWRAGRAYTKVGPILGCDGSYVCYLEKRRARPGRKIAHRIEMIAGIPASAWDDVDVTSRWDAAQGAKRRARKPAKGRAA